MNNNSIQVFEDNEQGFSVRKFTDDNGEVWFVGKDIADSLGYSKQGSMQSLFAHVPDIWKGSKRIATPGGMQDMTCLTEQGVYFFLGRSDKPKALPYQMWIAGEVVPTLRKTGSYSMPEKATPAVKHKEKKQLPQTSAPVKAAEKIITNLFKCKKTEDFEAVLALDKVFFDTFGQSAIVIAGYRIIKDITHVLLHIGTGVITDGEDEISYSLRKTDTVDFSLLSDEPCIEVIHDEEKYIDPDTVRALLH